MTTPIWYQLAVQEIGVREIVGLKNSARVVEYHQHTGLAASDDETPWCGSFIAWCMKKSGIKYNKGPAATAASWLQWGQQLKEPVIGCVVIRSRVGGNHVHFFGGWVNSTKTSYWGTGGNQGNAVSTKIFPVKGIRGFRWPSEVSVPRSVKPLIQSSGIQGAAVTCAGGLAVVAENAAAINGALTDANDRFKTGDVVGLITGVIVLLAAVYIIYQRVKSARDEKAMSEPHT